MPNNYFPRIASRVGRVVLFISLPLLVMQQLQGCATGIPDNVKPVTGFDAERYLGKWYEIARLDHRFEEGLSNVTAEYSKQKDEIKVVNRGFDTEKGKWDEAVGKAKFAEAATTGYLEVSFFGPFYGSYVVFELDKNNYQYSLVAGADKSYLWILARDPQLDKTIVDKLVAKAKAAGFPTDELVWVSHDQVTPATH